jgi:putative component of membrane protein insertase Oxa1/YidC/SpoIIIJ protein YidD
MTFIARSCMSLLELSARVQLPPVLDKRAAAVAIRVVGMYQKVVSSRTGRTCLFRKSCSHATLDFLAEFGWNGGIVRARDRVRSCGGTYTLANDVSGRAVLITANGQMFSDDELSDLVARRSGADRGGSSEANFNGGASPAIRGQRIPRRELHPLVGPFGGGA